MKEKFASKLEAIDKTFCEVRETKSKLLECATPLTLGGLKQALSSVESIHQTKESLLSQYKLDSSELKLGNSSHYAAPDHAFFKVAGWLNRVLFHV